MRQNSVFSVSNAISRELHSKYDDVLLVANNINNVIAAGELATAITDVPAFATNINTIASSMDVLTSITDDKVTLDAIYAMKAAIDSLYADKATLDSLFADKIVLDSLYADKAQLDAIYADIGTIAAVGANMANVNTVATNIAGIIAITTNLTEILLADDNAAIATTKAGEASASALAASNSEAAAAASETATGLDATATAADALATAADVLITNADVATTNSDVLITNADAAQTALDAAATAADVVATNADVVLTAADVVTSTAAKDAAIAAQGFAEAAQTSVENIFDTFDDRFLGAKAVAPTLDNDGQPLLTGAVYYNTVSLDVWFYNGSIWESPDTAAATSAQAAADSAAAALISEGLADADATQTALDVAATNADVLITNADVLATNADVVLTHADVVITNADAAQTALDAAATSADATQTGLDAAATAADVVTTNANVVSTNADATQTALDVIATGNNVTATNADAVLTAADVVLASGFADAAEASALSIANGRTWYILAVDPTTEGIDGDAAYNTTTTEVFKKVTGSWVSQTILEGEKIDHITRTVGTGAPGTTDTYTIYGDIGETEVIGTFDVYNGADGAGVGDLLAVNNLSDVADAPTALSNIGGIGAATTDALSNKTLTDVSNNIHANAVHFIAYNATAGILTKGTPVTITEHGVNGIEVAVTNQATMVASGIIEEDIAIGATGPVTSVGEVTGINVDSYPEGTILYVNNGTLTPTEPTTGYAQPIAVVLKDAIDGIIQVLAAYPKQDAADVRLTAVGNVASTDVQSAIAELDTEKEPADATILKDADIGVNVQAYNLNYVVDASYVHTDNNFTTALKTNYDAAYNHSIAAHAPTNADNTAANETSHGSITLGTDSITNTTLDTDIAITGNGTGVANIDGNAATVNSLTVLTAVPGGALFTDTTYPDVTTTTGGVLTDAQAIKFDGIEASANNYTHPVNHPPSIITQDLNNRFVTDAEKTTWNGKADAAHTHTGVYEPADATIVKDADIGVTVQAYDANTVKDNTVTTFSAAQKGAVGTVTYTASVALDMDAKNNFAITLTGNITLANPINISADEMQGGIIKLTQDVTGGRTLTLGANWKLIGADDADTTSNKVNIYQYTVIDSTNILLQFVRTL